MAVIKPKFKCDAVIFMIKKMMVRCGVAHHTSRTKETAVILRKMSCPSIISKTHLRTFFPYWPRRLSINILNNFLCFGESRGASRGTQKFAIAPKTTSPMRRCFGPTIFLVFCTYLTSEVRFHWGLVCIMRLCFLRITPTSRGYIFPAPSKQSPPSSLALEMWGWYFAVARRVHRKIVAWKLEQ